MGLLAMTTVKIVDTEHGNLIANASFSNEIPSLDEIFKLGFNNSFGKVETSVIFTSQKAIIEAVENFYSALVNGLVTRAQQALQQLSPEESSEIVDARDYIVEAEIGQIKIRSKKLVSGNTTIFDPVGEFFDSTGPREKWHSPRLRELEMMFVTLTSERCSAEMINRIRNQDNKSIIPTTLRNRTEKDGLNVLKFLSQKTASTLSRVNFDNWFSESPLKPKYSFDSSYQMNSSQVEAEAKKLGISKYKYNPDDFEEPTHTTNISVDEICVKGQNPNRPMPPEKEKRKHIFTSVAHIENKKGRYTLVDNSIQSLLRQTTAFLEDSSILNNDQLVFFTDGAKEIHDKINNIFPYTKYKIILDWFRLEKKFKEFSSLAFSGKKHRNEFLNIVRPVLWRGDVDGAINLLEKVDSSIVKNPTPLSQLVIYLNRVRDIIPCYALRKKLCLKNSSNRGEKANDIVIAKRQKKNGMSWSPEGSLGLAVLTCLKNNGELNNWAHHQTISFKLVPNEFKKAA
jgi:hypothetical protein